MEILYFNNNIKIKLVIINDNNSRLTINKNNFNKIYLEYRLVKTKYKRFLSFYVINYVLILYDD